MRAARCDELAAFVGRAQERAELLRLVREHRLVTVTGPPGVGKSRLAREVVKKARGCTAVWVDASHVRTSFDLMGEIGAALGVPRTPSAIGTRLAALGSVVLLLDDLREPAGFDPSFLAAHPTTSLVVTAPAAIGIAGEQRFALRPLPVDHATSLFVERARAARHDYVPAVEDTRTIARLARRLDGLPLAIELAATMMATLTEAELLATFSSFASHDVLVAAVERSTSALQPTERVTLAKLSVFEGSFGTSAAAAALGVSKRAALLRITALAEKSLVQRDRYERGKVDEPRFTLLAIVRASLRRSRVDRDARHHAERLHARFFVDACRCFPLEGEDEELLLAQLAQARVELVAVAARGARSGASPEAMSFAARAELALEPLLARRGRLEPHLRILSRLLARAAALPARLRARVLAMRGRLVTVTGRRDGRGDLVRAVTLSRNLRDPSLTAQCESSLGVAEARRGNLDGAMRHFERAEAIFRARRSRADLAVVLGHMGLALQRKGHLERALDAYARVAELMPASPAIRAGYHLRVGAILHLREELEAALGEYQRARDLARSRSARRERAIAFAAIGILLWEAGRIAESLRAHRRAIALARTYGDDAYVGICEASLAGLLATTGDVAEARVYVTRARHRLALERNPLLSMAVDLYEANIWVTEAASSRDATVATRLRERARAVVRSSTRKAVAFAEDVVVARRILEARLSPRLRVHHDGAWFVPPSGAARVSLRARPTLARLLAALARRRDANGVVDVSILVDEVWPGEKMSAVSSTNRLYVAVHSLRRLGLEGILVRVDTGYALLGGVDVVGEVAARAALAV